MCLDRLKEIFTIDESETEWQEGWKVFDWREGWKVFDEIHDAYLDEKSKPRFLFSDDVLEFDKVLRAIRTTIVGDNFIYDAGFHIFLNREDAINYSWSPMIMIRLAANKIYKVKYRKVNAIGKQNIDHGHGAICIEDYMAPCIVAQEMLIETQQGDFF